MVKSTSNRTSTQTTNDSKVPDLRQSRDNSRTAWEDHPLVESVVALVAHLEKHPEVPDLVWALQEAGWMRAPAAWQVDSWEAWVAGAGYLVGATHEGLQVVASSGAGSQVSVAASLRGQDCRAARVPAAVEDCPSSLVVPAWVLQAAEAGLELLADHPVHLPVRGGLEGLKLVGLKLASLEWRAGHTWVAETSSLPEILQRNQGW